MCVIFSFKAQHCATILFTDLHAYKGDTLDKLPSYDSCVQSSLKNVLSTFLKIRSS